MFYILAGYKAITAQMLTKDVCLHHACV